ncbi:MAG: hypothetical protein Q4G33_03540 [bacterium]|nr:hypothetical protein [bacterium]
MSEFIIEMDGWDRIRNKYIFPLTPDKNNWYDVGLIPKNDYTADLFGWYGFSFETEIHGRAEIVVTAGLLDFGEVHSEETIDYYTWRATVYGDGIVKLIAPLSQFDIISSTPARWKFLRSLEINREVKHLKALKGKGVYAHANVLSKPAQPGEMIEYKMQIVNCLNIRQSVSFNFERTGYEVLAPYITEKELLLEPFEEKTCYVRVQMNDKIVEGGFEKHRIHILPNGDGSQGQILEFYSVRRMRHPYIANTEDGWQEVIEKAKKYAWASEIADSYIKRAEQWEVPEVGHFNHGMFITDSAHKCYNSAIAWKLTGRIEFAQKAALFLKSFSDRSSGYPVRRKAGSQQLVHEGEFFKSCAMAYDLICDSGVLTEAVKEDILYSFRLFVDFIDWELADGGISNWSLAEIAGAMYCAMDLQDRERIERFVFGTGGILAHLKAGVYSDGWWCECTIGYNQMAAGLFSEYTIALRPWGINLASWWVPANYSNKVHFRNPNFDGLSWDIYGSNSRNYRCIEDLWDSLVALANYRSVIQGVNDSAEDVLRGASPVAFDSRYDLAYAIYRKPEYAEIINNSGERSFRDLLHGVGELPDVKSDIHKQSFYFDNGGVALLRSKTEGREESEQFEISLKYGSHGGAHGHYDRCALNEVSRFGKSLFNPENIWYSYSTFMYKFFVQNSITHNMVTVDLKQQDPQDSRKLLFHTGELFQAVAVETCAKWCNPPYGGWRVVSNETFADRAWTEGRYVPIPENAPPYTKRTGFTEPIMQRRLAVLTDDYVVCFDYISGIEEHDYHCIYHLPGLQSVENADMIRVEHMEQLVTDPLSSAQFITDVDRYKNKGTVKLSFSFEYTDELSAKAPWTPAPFRSGMNIPGKLNTDLYYVQDTEDELFVGCDPENALVSKRLYYKAEADGEQIAGGKFGAWILGRDHIDADVSGKKELKLYTRTEDGEVEIGTPGNTIKTIFWGDPYFITKRGEKIYLAELKYTTSNIDKGNGIGVDYGGGSVKIQTKKFEMAVPGDVIDKNSEGVITVDISGLNAVRFVSDIGGDYPVGDERNRRRMAALMKRGRTARFVSIIEPYTDKKMIKHIRYTNDNKIAVELNDGRTQVIDVSDLDTGIDTAVTVSEYLNGQLVRRESGKGIEK